MKQQHVVHDFDDWRAQARRLLASGVQPNAVRFVDAMDVQSSLFVDAAVLSVDQPSVVVARVSPKFIELARKVACHCGVDRYDLLYRVLWRLAHDEPFLLEVTTDDDVNRLNRMQQAVRRAAHKTKAFVRFCKVDDDGQERYVAWHKPEHRVLPLVAPFFARRFPTMHWTILTPDVSVTWDLTELRYGPGLPATEAPEGDALEDLWRTYYGSIFNPARIKLAAMKREMPVRHWATLPETRIIPELLADAPRRVAEMIEHGQRHDVTAADFLPTDRSLLALAAAAAKCEGCDLHQRATQTVFGQGSATARLMLVGEQPGDREDLAGVPFIGPAGQVLHDALEQAGLDRGEVYITNAVKHFHWQPSGKRRLHSKPPARAVTACRPWFEAELAAVLPQVLVCLGVTAAQAAVGRDSRMLKTRGAVFRSASCESTLITWHPAAILRAPTPDEQTRRAQELAEHLKLAATLLRELSSKNRGAVV
jgi:DNA polymerase